MRLYNIFLSKYWYFNPNLNSTSTTIVCLRSMCLHAEGISDIFLNQKAIMRAIAYTVFLTEPILTVEVSPSSVTISPNDQFTVICTARAEVDGQGLPVEVLRWVRITRSPSGSLNYFRLNSTEYDITVTGTPGSGYHSILTTTENGIVNTTIYLCRARISDTKNFSDVLVTIEGSHCTLLSNTSISIGM